MTSSYHIRQSRQPGSLSHSVDTSYLKSMPCNNNNNNNNATLEGSSFDSTRTDLSANSRDVIIGEQWLVLGRIGEGSFGEVFEGTSLYISLFCYMCVDMLLFSGRYCNWKTLCY